MMSFKIKLLTIGLSVVVLGGILGRLAIDYSIPGQNARAGKGSAEEGSIEEVQTTEISPETTEIQWKSKITFSEALRTAEAKVSGKAYSIERETENGKPVIEVGIAGQEVFVDTESGEIMQIDNLRQNGDREDIAEITEALKLQPLATLTVQEALQAGERFAGGQAHTVKLENKRGKLVYAVVVGMQKVFVDVGNGQILFTETVGQTENSDRSDSKNSVPVPSTE